jgi:hypothetical protein
MRFVQPCKFPDSMADRDRFDIRDRAEDLLELHDVQGEGIIMRPRAR